MRHLKIILYIVVGIILLEAVFLWYALTTTPPFPAFKAPTDVQISYWKNRIISIGGARAYQELKQHLTRASFGDAHSLAHIFGATLYDTLGLSGISICDNEFAFGCYHSFFGKAVSDKGLSVIANLDNACVAAWGERGLGCSHGIGHGLLSSLGEDKLKEALLLCATLSWKGPIGGCSSGVFMEYNFRTMENPSGGVARQYDQDDPYHPCNNIPTVFRQACYFEQPDWWKEVLSHNYTKIGSLCRAVSGEPEREACFRGVGHSVAPYTKYSVSKTIDSCRTVGRSNDEQILCRQGASWSFYANPEYREESVLLCEGMTLDDQVHCQSGSDPLHVK